MRLPSYWRPKHVPLFTWGRCWHVLWGAFVCFFCGWWWGQAGLAVGVVLAALLAWSWERATHYLAPLRGWPHPYGDVRDLAAYVVGALLVAIPAAQAADWAHQEIGPRRALTYVQVSQHEGTVDSVAANYGMVRNTMHPETAAELRAINPNIILLLTESFHGVPVQDYDGPDNIQGTVANPGDDYEMEPFAVQDSIWWPLKQIQYTYIQNLRRGVEWAYLTTTGEIADENYYGRRALNVTDECPVGVWGKSIGLTYMEYAELVYTEIMQRPEFYNYLDGFSFDTMPPKCCFDGDWSNVDYDYDGISDHCWNRPNGCNQCVKILNPADSCAINFPWQLHEKAASDQFFTEVFAARRDNKQIIQIGQGWLWRVDPVVLHKQANGWKLEDWMKSGGYGNPPCNQTWQCWWDGTNNFASYYGSERDLEPFVGAQYDSLQGWEFTIVDALMEASWTQAQKAKFARFSLATTMLGDGYHSATSKNLLDEYIPPEWHSWRVVYPALGDTIMREDPDNAAWDQICREYLRTDGDTCMVCADPEDAEGFMYDQGACCVSAVCTLTYEDECAGVWHGAHTECDPNPCDEGACCTPIGTCTIEAEIDCTGDDVYMGDGVLCTPDPCTPTTGACCDGSDDCTITTEAGCAGDYLGDGIACSPNPCPLDITSLPVTLSASDRIYRFAIPGAPDSTTYELDTPAITVTGTNVTLQADDYLIARLTSGSKPVLSVQATGFVCNGLQSRNMTIVWTAQNSTFYDCVFRTVANGLRLGTVNNDGTAFYRCSFADGSAQNGITLTADTILESCLNMANTREAIIITGAPDVSIINGTIVGQGGTRVALVTHQTGGTLTLYNTIIRSENALALNASQAAWTGLTHSHNWYGRETGSNLILYAGVTYTSGSAFEPNSRSGPLDFENDTDNYHGDYSIVDGGSGTDLGENAVVTLATDITGDTRIRNDVVDMGAYESAGEPPPTGACCFTSGNCSITTENGCAGTYQGDDTTCTPNPCPAPEQGACCFEDGSCVVTTQALCTQTGGSSWIGNEVCNPNPCPRPGACCINLVCTIELLDDCAGTWLGEGTTCTPDPCEVTSGCPPPGYIEIESLPVSFTASHAGNKYAICGPLTVSSAHGTASITISSAHGIEINGFGVGSLVGGGASSAIRINAKTEGALITGLTFDINSVAIRCLGDSVHIVDNEFYSQGSSAITFEPKAAPEDPDGQMTNSGLSDNRIVGIGPFSNTTRLISMGTAPPCVDCFFDDNYLYMIQPGLDGVGLQGNHWIGGTVQRNQVIIHDTTLTVEPIKMAKIRGTHISQNYVWGEDAGFCSFRGTTEGDPTSNSHELIIEDNWFVNGWRALSVDADSSIVRHNVIAGGTSGTSGNYSFRVSSSVDTIHVENNLIIAAGGVAVQWNYGRASGAAHVIGNTIVAGGTAHTVWDNSDGSARTGQFHNNIIYALNNATVLNQPDIPSTGFSSTHNIYRASAGGTLINWGGTIYSSVAAWNAATGYGANSSGSDPLLVNARPDTLGDFRLRDISPALDAGDSTFATVTVDLDSLVRVVGSQIDLGAYEFGSVVPTLNGACCYLDGSCDVVTEAVCNSTGGIYQGDNEVCSPNPCPLPTGACCYNDGTCAVVTEASCTGDDGAWQGADVTCVQAACPGVGACCLANGSCAIMLEAECDALLGDWLGVGSPCTPNTCALPTGACCVNAFDCYVLDMETCVNDSFGSYQGDGVPCVEDVTCGEATGACCFGGFCQVETESECELGGGIYQGDREDCSPNPCDVPTGACCIDGDCSQITADACDAAGGIWYGTLAFCSGIICPEPIGACCLLTAVPIGLCIQSTEAACESVNGLWTEGQVCDDVDCDEYGVRDGQTAVIVPTTNWISTFGPDNNHCDDDEIKVAPPSSVGGYGLLRFDIPAGLIPSNAMVVDARVQAVVKTVGGTPGDMEVYPLRRDPVICESTWNVYATGQSWAEAGGLDIPQDRLLPAIADQMATGVAEGDTLMLAEGPAAREWVWNDLLPDRTATLWVSLETGSVWFHSAESLNPPQLVLTYVLLDSRRRAAIQKMGR